MMETSFAKNSSRTLKGLCDKVRPTEGNLLFLGSTDLGSNYIYKISSQGPFLVVQWLRHQVPNAG